MMIMLLKLGITLYIAETFLLITNMQLKSLKIKKIKPQINT